MDCFRKVSSRQPPPPPPPPPPSNTTSPGAATPANTLSKQTSSSRLSTPSSPRDVTDPAPFVARKDDRVSLNQVLEPRDAVPPIADIVDALERPITRRRSTVSLHHEYSRSLHKQLSAASRNGSKPKVLDSSSVYSSHQSDDGKCDPLFHLSAADASRYSPNESSSSDEIGGFFGDMPTSISTQSGKNSANAFPGFEGVHTLTRAHTHSGILVPTKIQLRRASSKDANIDGRRQSDASTIRPARPKRPTAAGQATNAGLAPPTRHKSALAGTALTHTYVHLFLPSDPQDERRASLQNGRRKVSATLQVVRSRDSVYETIWEDEDLIVREHDFLRSTSTSTSSSSGQENVVPKTHSPSHHSKDTLDKSNFSSKMTKWSWEGELEPHIGSAPSTWRPTIYATPRTGSPPPEAIVPAPESPSAKATPPPVLFSPIIEEPYLEEVEANFVPASSPETTPLDLPSPNIPEPMPRRSSSPRPPPSPFLGGSALSPKRRRELLGKRKASNQAPAEEHFTTHRDSLVLAHKRIFQEDIDAAASHVGDALSHGHEPQPSKPESPKLEPDEGSPPREMRISQLKHETWHRPVPRASPPRSPMSSDKDAYFSEPPGSPFHILRRDSTSSAEEPVASSSKPSKFVEKPPTKPKSILRPGSRSSPSTQKVQLATDDDDDGDDAEGRRAKSRSEERKGKGRSDPWYADAMGL